MSINPYAAPESDLTSAAPDAQSCPPIWNPNAAANWCLLFSVCFGSYLHMKNWQALGEADKARSAKAWLIVSVVLLVSTTLVSALLPGAVALQALGRLGFFVLLISWYFAAARPQARYVQARFGANYARRTWGAPFLYAFGGVVAVFVLGFVSAFVRTFLFA